MTEEERRLRQPRSEFDWKIWGPYLSERSWGTVREDYSADGSAWTSFPHDHARSRAYRWNEDGLLGICDRRQYLCFALALWNGKDPILKERAFGLTGPEGNHGEDVKEYFYFLDSTPTHSYMKALYKYPQRAFPYDWLVAENGRRGRQDPEFELLDTGVFEGNRYFDVQVEYAKADIEDMLIRLTVFNRGPEEASLVLMPSLWFRNTWSWSKDAPCPRLWLEQTGGDLITAEHPEMGRFVLTFETHQGLVAEPVFTENETNAARLYGAANRTPYVKDAFHRYVVNGEKGAVNPEKVGTKAAVIYRLQIPAGGSQTVRLRLAKQETDTSLRGILGRGFEELFRTREEEADAFYESIATHDLSEDLRSVQRQAFAGLMWSKQFYNYDVRQWLKGDETMPPPPAERWQGRNHDWMHIANDSVLSMPDSWEYPWYAAWDLAFHTIPLAIIDPDFAKHQLVLLLREWFMHPSGQLPAYEWAFGDVNPPVHAWAALRVYRIERKMRGTGDRLFLERVFQKLLLNFTWWVNRKDADGRNIFQGGFLGLDNIGLFDRSKPLPHGAHVDQSDGTAWMGMYCLNMLGMAVELATEDPAYEDVATKFLEHFFYIADAMNGRSVVTGDEEIDLWDEQDGFYYDVMHEAGGAHQFLRVRSMVGLIPLLAVETIDSRVFQRLPEFAHRFEWFLTNRPELCESIASVRRTGKGDRRLFAIVHENRLRRILARVLDEGEFLSPYGLRSVSKYHEKQPATLKFDGTVYTVDYEPAESRTDLFGGNSNWRGPVWFPLNYLLIEALQKFDFYFGDDFRIECPTGSGRNITLWEVATDLSKRLISLFARDESGRRPVFGGIELFQQDPLWRDLLPFHEYFHGDNGAGLGAAHQTGWTSLVAKLIQQSGSVRPAASSADRKRP